MKKFELAIEAVVLSTFARADTWTDDFTKCNMYRAIDQECPEEKERDGIRY